jgi:hypothetical protein
LNRKEAIAVGIAILASLVGGVFASTSSPSSSNSLTPQTTSVDIEALKVVPGLTAGTAAGVLIFNGSNTRFGSTVGFSFAPAKGFTQVNSILITIIYAPDSAPENVNDKLTVQLNGHSSNFVSIPFFASFPLSGLVSVSSLAIRVGANTVTVSVLRGGASDSAYYLYEIRLTVEYVFLG